MSGWRLARVPCAARSRIPTAYVAVSRRLAGKGTTAPSSTIGMAATGQGQIERTFSVVPLITRATPDRKRASPAASTQPATEGAALSGCTTSSSRPTPASTMPKVSGR